MFRFFTLHVILLNLKSGFPFLFYQRKTLQWKAYLLLHLARWSTTACTPLKKRTPARRLRCPFFLRSTLLSVTHLSFKHVLPGSPVGQYSLLSTRPLVLLVQRQLIIAICKQTVLVVVKHDQFSRVHSVRNLARVGIIRCIAIVPLPLGTASRHTTPFCWGLVWGEIVVNTCGIKIEIKLPQGNMCIVVCLSNLLQIGH